MGAKLDKVSGTRCGRLETFNGKDLQLTAASNDNHQGGRSRGKVLSSAAQHLGQESGKPIGGARRT